MNPKKVTTIPSWWRDELEHRDESDPTYSYHWWLEQINKGHVEDKDGYLRDGYEGNIKYIEEQKKQEEKSE